jgi:hypothetical protein
MINDLHWVHCDHHESNAGNSSVATEDKNQMLVPGGAPIPPPRAYRVRARFQNNDCRAGEKTLPGFLLNDEAISSVDYEA